MIEVDMRLVKYKDKILLEKNNMSLEWALECFANRYVFTFFEALEKECNEKTIQEEDFIEGAAVLAKITEAAEILDEAQGRKPGKDH
jgi:hypothetical protein